MSETPELSNDRGIVQDMVKLLGGDKRPLVAAPKPADANKRALLIGINYFGTESELRGCHNDVDRIKNVLVRSFGYNPEAITVMKDSARDRYHREAMAPTHDNILREMKRHVEATQAGQTLYIHYSGHGSYTRDANGDEADGNDEQICPVDMNFILDDELHRVLVDSLKTGAKLRCVFDCCHSGTILDTKYRWRAGEKSYSENTCTGCVDKDVLMISGCLDSQTSADAYINRSYAGALTWGLCECVDEATNKGNYPFPSTLVWKDIMSNIRFKLSSSKYEQIPQISYTKEGGIKSVFDL